jgi:hypothetical protein
MPEEDMVDIKFRLYDGSDIGPFRCSSSTSTVDMLKQRIVSDWPRGFILFIHFLSLFLSILIFTCFNIYMSGFFKILDFFLVNLPNLGGFI